MAKILDKDPFTYQKERESFLRDLHRFHVGRGTTYTGFPCLGGKQVDLYLLYTKVTQLGGWVKVTDEQKWEEIQDLFNVPQACANAAQALKIIYVRYLSHYEKVHHFGEDPDRIRDDQLDDNSMQARKKTTGPVGGVPMSYNYGQHNIPEHIRQSMGLKTAKHLVSSGEYKNLVHSLMSGLPNEVDFALNICTLLSNEGQHTIELQRCPHILKLFLAHMGIYEHDYESLYMLHEQGWKNYTKRNFSRFWYDSVRDKEIRKFLTPGSLQISKATKCFSPPLPSPESGGEDTTDGIIDSSKQQNSEDNDPDLHNIFALGRDLGIHNVEGQRVLQLAMIIRNLSFEKDNMRILARDEATFRFLMLCIHSKYNALRQLALDTLTNIALGMVLRPVAQPTTKLVFQLIAHCIASPDKFDVISGLDMLARLCQVEANEDAICDNLEDATYEDIVRLLTIHDIQLIVYSLETLYQLSELGEVTTTHIAAVKMAVETLINLVTVEAQSYGPESLVGIRVVEHVTTVPVTGDKVMPTTSQASIQQQMAVPQPATPLQPESKATVQVAQPAGTLVNNNPNKARKPISTPVKRPQPCPVTPARPDPVVTPPPVTPSPAALTKAAVQPLKAQAELDSDTLACNWLQAYYEFVGTQDKAVDDIPKMELYGEFLTTCGQLFIKNIANANSFANCVRMTFSKVESVKVKRPDGTIEQIYRGLKKRDVPLPFPPNTEFPAVMTPVHGLQRPPVSNAATAPLQHSSLGHPVSNKLQSPPLSPTRFPQGIVSSGAPVSPTNYPTIQQALLGGRVQDTGVKLPPSQSTTAGQGANSTLIKSLLANKVSQNISKQHGEQVSPVNSLALGQWSSQVQQPFQSYQGQPNLQQSQECSTPSSKSAKNKKTTSPPGTPTSKKLPSRIRPSRNRNNGHEVVITDSKAIEDLIESVARQGSMDSDEESQKEMDEKHLVGHEIRMVSEEDGKGQPLDVMPGPGGNNCADTMSTSSTSGDVNSSLSINGTGAERSSTLNGESNSLKVEQSSTDNSSSHVMSDKTKPQVVLNGVIHHIGNGNCNRLTKTKTKDLENMNSMISEGPVMVNSQSSVSQDDVTSCGDGLTKSASIQANKDVLENGFGLPTSEMNYEIPQLDGTHDDEPKTELCTTSAAHHTSLPQAVSSVRSNEVTLTNPVTGNTSASQSLPVKMIYTQGHLTPTVQAQMQVITSAGRPVTYVPQATPTQAQVVQGQPQVIQGQPQVVQAQPQVVQGQPQVVQAQPQMVQGQPQVVQGQPQVVQGQPQVVQGQPQVVQGQPQVVQGQPQLVQGQLQVVQGQAQVVQGQRQVVQGQPQVVQGQVQVVQSVAQPQLATGQSTTPVIAQPGQTQLLQNPLQLQQQQLQLQQQQLQMQLQQLQQMQQQIQQQWIQTQQQLNQTVGQQGTAASSQGPTVSTQSGQSYIVPKPQTPTSSVQQTTTSSSEQTTAVSQATQISPNQQAYILPKPQSQQQPQPAQQQQPQQQQQQPQQQQQQQQVQMLLRPQQLTQQMQAVNQQASLAIGVAQSGQSQTSVVGLPVSVQQVSLQQAQSTQATTTIQAQPQISVQATRFVLPQGQMAVRPQVSVQPISSQYTQVQPQLIHTQSQAAVQPQVLQSQVRSSLVQGQAVTQTGQPQVIQQAVRTHLVQQPHVIPTHGQPQVLTQTQVMQQHFIQQRQLMQQCQVTQQGQVIQPVQGQNVVVSGQSQAPLVTQTVIQRPQYVQSSVIASPMPSVTVTQSQLLQGQPQVIQTQAQYLQKGQLVQPGSTPQIIQQTTASGAKVTVMLSQPQLLQYQQAITSQQQLIQKQLATSLSQAASTSGAQPAVTAPTIQIPVSQSALPLSQSSTPQTQSVTSSPVSTPPPPSPQSSKASPNTAAVLNKKKRPAVSIPPSEKFIKKKKPMPVRSNSTESRPPSRNQNSQPSPAICTNKYHCEWAGCKQWFDTIKLFNRHVIKEHFEKQHQQAVCRWEGCDGLRRPKWSLMTHLQDRHLNDTSLKNPAKKPEPAAPTTNASKPPTSPAPASSTTSGPLPVYPDNAAIQAIRRFTAKPPFAEFVEMKEGPVTKHIRLTSALVLRNLARYSALGRSLLKKHEERLSYVAMSAVEASSPIANCLWELHQTDPH